MNLAIHEHATPYPDIITSLYDLGNVYHELGKLGKALEKHQQIQEMEPAIQRQGRPHLDKAAFLNYFGSVYLRTGKPEKALEKHHQSMI